MFGPLDYVYLPTPDLDRALAFYVATLGATLDWKIRHFGTVVARVRISPQPPALLLAAHLAGPVPLLIYWVDDLDGVMADLRARGWQADGEPFEIPHGPCVTFRDPSGQRFALYQLLRPEVNAEFTGRIDP